MNLKEYNKEYEESINNTWEFWRNKATSLLHWDKMFTVVHSGHFGQDQWFSDGELNACYNCIDRWAMSDPDRIALIFDSNDATGTAFTYRQCLHRICEIANHLTGLNTGDCVTLYLSMSPEAVFCALACARLGLPHNAVFGGFSPASLRLRIIDSQSKLLITQDFAFRGEKQINFLLNASLAIQGFDINVIVFDRHNSDLPVASNIKYWSKMLHSPDFIPCVPVNAEHPLFYLYTSGSTGSPKGVVHATGGYLLYAAYTLQTAFGILPNDRFCCTADIGWITGHSYSIYGPLCLGIASVILEGLPTFPTNYRFFDIVHKYRVTQLYTAPTAVRLLKKHFDLHNLDTSAHDLSSLRCLGSVGEPINKEAHRFFSNSFGGLHIVDTYWQTETGGFLIAPIYGVGPAKPGCASRPLPGIVPLLTDECIDVSTASKIGELCKIYIARPWPGLAKTILNNKERYLSGYFSTPCYFTGDEGVCDTDGDIWVMGRADDVVNVAGHKISTAEVESVACSNVNVAEAAMIPVWHEIKGQAIVLFVVLKRDTNEYETSIENTIVKELGGFCRPERIIKCDGIPKTATGKIMRRVMKSLMTGDEIGDVSTCINKECIDVLRRVIG